MEFTEKLFIDFLNQTIAFNKSCRSLIQERKQMLQDREKEESGDWHSVQLAADKGRKKYSSAAKLFIEGFRQEAQELADRDLEEKDEQAARLCSCKEQLALLESAEKYIVDKKQYEEYGHTQAPLMQEMTADSLLLRPYPFAQEAYRVNQALKSSDPGAPAVCASFYAACRKAEKLLKEEIGALREKILENQGKLHEEYGRIGKSSQDNIARAWRLAEDEYEKVSRSTASLMGSSRLKTEKVRLAAGEKVRRELEKLEEEFCRRFPPQELEEEYERIYSAEPVFEGYQCSRVLPRQAYFGTLEFEADRLGLCVPAKSFLSRRYPFLYRGGKLSMPDCVSFGPELNSLFCYQDECRGAAAGNACDLGLHFFAILPPRKLNVTLIDPVRLGESFAIFMQLADADDRTREVLNGKIWSSPDDIEKKLKILTDHISNVTQRCLQGKFSSIYEYNRVAGQNAEAYHVLMLMDYPAGLTELALRLLEQIAASGPKCGVFTFICRNEAQMKKLPERFGPLLANIERGFRRFDYSGNKKEMVLSGYQIGDLPVFWKARPLLRQKHLDSVIAVLKHGIANAEKPTVGFGNVRGEAGEISSSTKDGIRIPVGTRGAKEIQYLTLGRGGSHHVLIAGLTRLGKSSLLHTIIMQALCQYRTPDEIAIYLVDFKRGVEFKVYADYILPVFRVIAVETEREFGYHILRALDREQKIRADLFKKKHVDKIEEFRELPEEENQVKMPRILVIMDEFHELFSNEEDRISRESAMLIERIVRQGAGFGIHLILSSQSYSNVKGIDRAVFDQMAVRIVFKCSNEDANLLLENGESEIGQISTNDRGHAVYNSEAGNKVYNTHFRAAYINPDEQRSMLEELSAQTAKYLDPKRPTRILLSNIEDNQYSIFNRFVRESLGKYRTPGRIYIGEPLSVVNRMVMEFTGKDASNLLMIGDDTEKARSMFVFAVLSLCINYRIMNGKAPEEPFLTFFNCKPLDDSYFLDLPKLIAGLLPEYVEYLGCGETEKIRAKLSRLYGEVCAEKPQAAWDRYFFVFGYQRAEELKFETESGGAEDINQMFGLQPPAGGGAGRSLRQQFRAVVKDGPRRGIHTILWQDSFRAWYQDERDLTVFFAMKIAFDLRPEEYSRFVGVNDVSFMNRHDAIYCDRTRDSQKFRPYQAPDEEWLRKICEKLK